MATKLDNELPTALKVRAALEVRYFLWPEFVREHGCIFLARYAGSNPPPSTDTATGWESFVNHIHIFDEFQNEATKSVTLEAGEALDFVEESYNEVHPDFIAACELGRTAARLWAIKLKLDFPAEQFRVYYTEYDNPIVRFHKVRGEEPVWLPDQALQSATDPSFRNSLIYDTSSIEEPILGPSSTVQ
jgi:hypothetical protein